MNRFIDKFSIFATAILLCVVVILVLNSTLGKPKPTAPSDPLCSISFYDEDKETLLKEVKVKKGKSVTAPLDKEPTPYIVYTFKNWNTFDDEDATESLKSVQTDLKLYPVFTEAVREYSITFYKIKGGQSPLLSNKVFAGQDYTIPNFTFDPPVDEDYEYIFQNWVDENGNIVTGTFTNVLSDIVLYGNYEKVEKTYTLNFTSPYIEVKVGDGQFFPAQFANQMTLYKNSVITIRKVLPEGETRNLLIKVDGAEVVDESSLKYKVLSNVKITALLA